MKYIRRFNSVDDANTQGAAGLNSPQLNNVEGKSAINCYKSSAETFTAVFDENGVMNPSAPAPVITGITLYVSPLANMISGEGEVLEIEKWTDDWRALAWYDNGDYEVISDEATITNPVVGPGTFYPQQVTVHWSAEWNGWTANSVDCEFTQDARGE